ncbi:DUF4910 domain-containing protein [Cytobacillus suaedae]|nr:DUF4910 domain-containing protein [Cytobacillus suaedae]
MFNTLRNVIEEEISGKQAYRYAERIAQYHRIQASPGYREAANQVIQLLKRDGVEAELISYPARFNDRNISHKTFQEWQCRSAELWVESPQRKRIARFNEEEISLIQRSISTPPEGIQAELIIIDNADKEESYQGLDVEGKIALVRGNPAIIHTLAVERYKALGLIFDNLNEYPPFRTRMDFPDARQYTSYWYHSEATTKSFGFVVSPRISHELRELAEKGTVTLFAKVDAKLYDGHFENIEYVIPGQMEKEVLIVSHLCHPYPGGQDNASGPGTLMEVMRTLTTLIKNGALPKPEFGIRFLMMPEMNGTAAYFSQHPDRIKKTVAALNLDMVGADQSKGGGPLCVEQPPMALPTFVDRFMFKLVKEQSNNTSTFTGTSQYSTIHSVKTRFSGGSDHYIISDPTIGIPCPMLIQWPDKHYHTTTDTTGNLDESMLRLVGVVASVYCYGLANGEEEEWVSYLLHHLSQVPVYLAEAKDWVVKQNFTSDELLNALKMYEDYELKAWDQLKNYSVSRGFTKCEELSSWGIRSISQAILYNRDIIEKEVQFNNRTVEKVSKELSLNKVYKRIFIGPLRVGDELEESTIEEKVEWYKLESRIPLGYSDFIFYWMDGKRDLEEILNITKYETGQYHPDYTIELVKRCVSLKLIEEV